MVTKVERYGLGNRTLSAVIRASVLDGVMVCGNWVYSQKSKLTPQRVAATAKSDICCCVLHCGLQI